MIPEILLMGVIFLAGLIVGAVANEMTQPPHICCESDPRSWWETHLDKEID